MVNVGIMVMTIGIAAISEEDDDDDHSNKSDIEGDNKGDQDCEEENSHNNSNGSSASFSFKSFNLATSSQAPEGMATTKPPPLSSTAAKWTVAHEDSDDESDESGEDESQTITIHNPLAATDKPSLAATIRHAPRTTFANKSIKSEKSASSRKRLEGGEVDVEMSSLS